MQIDVLVRSLIEGSGNMQKLIQIFCQMLGGVHLADLQAGNWSLIKRLC